MLYFRISSLCTDGTTVLAICKNMMGIVDLEMVESKLIRVGVDGVVVKGVGVGGSMGV